MPTERSRPSITRMLIAAGIAALLGLQIGLNARVYLAEAYAANADAARQVGDTNTQAWSLARATALAPFRHDFALDLGVARQVQGDLNGARRAFGHSLKLAPNAVHTLLACAMLETQSGNLAVARDPVAKARALLPDYWRTALATAAIDVRAGNPQEAVETLRAALDLPGVERGPVMALLAQAYAALGDSAQALACTEEAATLRR